MRYVRLRSHRLFQRLAELPGRRSIAWSKSVRNPVQLEMSSREELAEF
jgi:hypothetical protein